MSFCCCGGPLVGPDSCATLKKWNSSGVLQWSRKRADLQGGGNPTDYSLYLGASDIYTAGTAAEGEDDGLLYKWSSLTTPAIAWEGDRNGFTTGAYAGLGQDYHNKRIEVASDGYIWTYGPTGGFYRYNSSGVMQAQALIALDCLLAGPSGDMFGWRYVTTPTRLQRINTSLTVTHTYNTVSDVAVYDASHLVVCSGSTNRIEIVDHTLSATSSYTGGGSSFTARIVVSGTDGYTIDGSTTRFGKYDLTGISQTWTNSTMQSTGSGYAPVANARGLIAVDGAGDLYTVVEKSGAFSKIQKRSPSDGSIAWEADIGVSKLENMRSIVVDSTAGRLAAIGRWYHGASSTNPKHIIVLDISDGSEVWSAVHGEVTVSTEGFFDVAIDSSGNVYACGSCGPI